MKFPNLISKFEFERFVVRLGEYDIGTESDGEHEDIFVDRAEPHTAYDPLFGINDIGMIYLSRHVNFNSKLHTHINNSHYPVIKFILFSIFSYLCTQ